MHSMILEVAALAAKHKLVPFLGAGCSRPHLAYAWKEITAALANELGTSATDPLEVAQAFVDRFGRAKFCAFLRERLLVDRYDALKGETHLQLLTLQLGSVYTTNQDNVFERCLEAYGRPYRVIVQLEDLGHALPGECLYYKYHGDLAAPQSVVFTREDYEARITKPHFMNIRLKSDLLMKHLLFVGFSFDDPGIRRTFQELREGLGADLPPSYLVAWQVTPELVTLCAEYGLRLIDPFEVHPECNAPGDALTKTLSDLIDETAKLKTAAELDEMFRPDAPSTRRVVTKYDVESVERVLTTGDLRNSISVFRNAFDVAVVPVELSGRARDLIVQFARRCQNNADSDALKAAVFNLYVSDAESLVDIVAAVFATANVRTQAGIFDTFLVHVHGFPEDLNVLALARAFELLNEWGAKLTDGIRGRVSSSIEHHSLDPFTLPPEIAAYVSTWFDRAWTDRSWGPHTTYEHPLARWRRLKAGGHLLRASQSFEQIKNSMMDSLPKRFAKPYE